MLTGAVGGLLSGLGSIFGASEQRKAQQEANRTNVQLARENNALQEKLAREANALQVSMMRENNQFNRQQAIDMFMMESAYNSPVKQMERLRAAGLNPAVMMEGAGSVASGNADIATPTAASAGISPQLPALTTPTVEPLPSLAIGFMDALQKVAQIKLTAAQTRKTGADADRIEKLVDEELNNLFEEGKLKSAQAKSQEIKNQIDLVYGGRRAGAEIKKLITEYELNKLKGETEKADAALKAVEKELTTSKNQQIKDQAPVILENLRKEGELIDERKKTEQSAQDRNRAAAASDRASAALTDEHRRLLKDQHDDLVRAEKYKAAKDEQQYREMVMSSADRLEKLYNEGVVTRLQIEEVRESVNKAKKENDWYHWNQAFDKLERINRGVNAWFSVTNY